VKQLDESLYIGPGIWVQDLARLRRAGITAILSLQQPGSDILPAAQQAIREACLAAPEVAYRNVAIRDYDPQDLIDKLPAALDALREFATDGHRTYVHCCEGVNRAPSVALGFLVLVAEHSVAEGLSRLRAAHPDARPYAEFVAWLRERCPNGEGPRA
jgi:predicted protein tyrosine phosphatase